MLRSLDVSTGSDVIILGYSSWDNSINRVREKCKSGEIVCPECKQQVVVKAGEKKINHFAQKSLGSCPLSSIESANVLQGRKLLYEWLSKKLTSKYPDNHKLVLEKTFPCEELRRPIDCYVELPNGKKFAYLILDSGIRSFGEIKQFFYFMEIPLVRIFLGNMMRLDLEKELLRLTPTERESITSEEFSLSYLDIESRKYTAYGGLNLRHSPHEYQFVNSISHDLSKMLISPKSGQLVHPGNDFILTEFGKNVLEEMEIKVTEKKIKMDEIMFKKGFCFNCGKKITSDTPSHTYKSGKTLYFVVIEQQCSLTHLSSRLDCWTISHRID